MSAIDELTTSVRTVLTHHVLEVGDDPVFVLNGDDRIILANRATSTFGTLGGLIGREWSELLHPADTASTVALAAAAPCARGGRLMGVSCDVRLECVDGGWRRMRMITYPVASERFGAVTVVVLRDQT